ncbi:MAG TPA: Dabb family protein [Bacteroidales bacterium]|nr:Dabb family protein [Bacteroidales bacterium]
MIRHIVMWTVKEGETPRMKFERMAEMKARLLELREYIPVIRRLEVGFNSPSASGDNFDVVLLTEFDSWADLDSYLRNPDHMKVAEYIGNVRQTRAAIDYEF